MTSIPSDKHAGSPAGAEPPAEQLRFGSVVFWGNIVGILVFLVTFSIYVTGPLPPVVPLDSLRYYYSLSLDEFIAATGMHTGWSWIGCLCNGDILSYIGVAVFSSICIAAYIAILPVYVAARDRAYILMTVLQVAVFLLAMTGLVGGMH